MGESHPTRVTKSLAQKDISAVNPDKYSPMPSVKGMDTVEESSAALHLPIELGINQVSESYKVRKSISWN